MSSECFSPEMIRSYVRMELGEETTIALMAHILECSTCQKTEAIEHTRQTSASKCVERKNQCLTWKRAMTAAFCIGFDMSVMLEDHERAHVAHCSQCRDKVYAASFFLLSVEKQRSLEEMFDPDRDESATNYDKKLLDIAVAVRQAVIKEQAHLTVSKNEEVTA